QTRPRQIQAILEDALLEAESAVRNEKSQVEPAPEPATTETPNGKGFPSQLTGHDAILSDGRWPICPLQFPCRQRFRGLNDGFQQKLVETVNRKTPRGHHFLIIRHSNRAIGQHLESHLENAFSIEYPGVNRKRWLNAGWFHLSWYRRCNGRERAV